MNKYSNSIDENQENTDDTKTKKTHRGRRKQNKQASDQTIGVDGKDVDINGENREETPQKPLNKHLQSEQPNPMDKTKSTDIKRATEKSGKTRRSTQRKPTIADSLKANACSKTSTTGNKLLEQYFFQCSDEESDDDMDEFIEYKLRPRSVFLANACNVCKIVETKTTKLNPCMHCGMVSYCSDDHRKLDVKHNEFCSVVCDERDNKGLEHIYANAKGLSMDEFRHLRIHKLTICQNLIGRQLDANEREILLFPRLCFNPQCREWKHDLLMNCPECKQVSYCKKNPEHLPVEHMTWCKQFKLFQEIMARLQKQENIDPELPAKIYLTRFFLPDDIKIFFKEIGSKANDECDMAFLSLIATGPLTVLYSMQKINMKIQSNVFSIHIVGAELQFEADTLNKWECFFLHLVPQIDVLNIVFVGPELNVENLPVELLGRIRMCPNCEVTNRKVVFQFQCKTLYHEYAKSDAFSKPDLVCAFNPGLHRITGYAGMDTWPDTISAIMDLEVPFVSTAYTELEAPLDLKRIQDSVKRTVKVLFPPQQNPYASLKPDRNFISEESVPLIFKNFYLTIVN
ncbi:uncharacterized protein LOC113388211 [Ctenocephalides felis]|uniref:uncharacterized protein LOC113388211 n=1 Tax=Ctenocephalides felis TaxID=7515 RepID=UPI000E6E53CF|nr:uncharacterized protein LOC113388211 [Ctenocephalides felis]